MATAEETEGDCVLGEILVHGRLVDRPSSLVGRQDRLLLTGEELQLSRLVERFCGGPGAPCSYAVVECGRGLPLCPPPTHRLLRFCRHLSCMARCAGLGRCATHACTSSWTIYNCSAAMRSGKRGSSNSSNNSDGNGRVPTAMLCLPIVFDWRHELRGRRSGVRRGCALFLCFSRQPYPLG